MSACECDQAGQSSNDHRNDWIVEAEPRRKESVTVARRRASAQVDSRHRIQIVEGDAIQHPRRRQQGRLHDGEIESLSAEKSRIIDRCFSLSLIFCFFFLSLGSNSSLARGSRKASQTPRGDVRRRSGRHGTPRDGAVRRRVRTAARLRLPALSLETDNEETQGKKRGNRNSPFFL